MQWCSSLIPEHPLAEALDAGTAEIINNGEGREPDLLLVFVSGHPPDAPELIPKKLKETFPKSLLLGCTAGGVVGNGCEIEQHPALSITAAWLPGVKLTPFHLSNEQALALLNDPEKLQKTLGIFTGEEPEFILLPDPFSFDPASFLKALDEIFPASGKIGGLASGAREPGGNRLFLKDKAYDSGLVGVAMCGDIVMDTLVAQGCRPIGVPMFITRGRDHLLYELDGQPALRVLGELYQILNAGDRELFNHSLFLGIAMRGHQQEYHAGDFLIRNLAGILEQEGALAIGAHLSEGQVVQFHLRDKNTSAHDLETICRRYQMAHGAEPQTPQGALLFSCLGRGVHLYGEPDHDSNLIKKLIGEIPIGGFFCNGEIGPVHHQTFLHGYTSSIGLFRKKQR
jgi:small ligand-binding sensory domain FIST